MAQAPPSTLASFSRTLFGFGDFVKRQFEHNYDFIYQALASDDLVWTRWQMICENLVSTVTADDAIVTFDVVNYTGGAIDTSWTEGDFAEVKAGLEYIATSWAALMSQGHSFTRLKAYLMTFNPSWAGSSPDVKMNPFQNSGVPVYESALNAVGTQSAKLPPQIAFSVTEEVPVRRAWGRTYLPFPAAGALGSTTDRWSAATVDSAVTMFESAYNSLAANEKYPIVPHTYSSKSRVSAWSQVSGLHADDVPDVIRSRRHKYTSYVHHLPVTAGTQPASSHA